MDTYGNPKVYDPFAGGWMEGDPTEIMMADAHPDDAQAVVEAAVETGDGMTRSPWFWMRFPNGDLLLGCWPQDDAYFDGEERRAV